MKYASDFIGLALILGVLSGCSGFAESMAGSVAGNTAFIYIKKHLTNPVSSSQAYALPAPRMVKVVNAVFRKRGYPVIVRDIKGEEPGVELVAEKPEGDKSVDLEISAIVRPLSKTKTLVEIRVHSARKGRTHDDDLFLSQEIVNEVSKKVRWG